MAGRLMPRFFDVVIDSNGAPIAGAKLWTYVSGTTTLKPTYTTPALSVANTNPLVADSAGRFATMWGADAEPYRCKLTDASGVQIYQEDDLVTLGADVTGAITRDFGVDGRFQFYSASGIANFEGGDPSPDDTGGKVRVGGWDLTQADTLSLDGLAVNVTGRLTEQNKKLPGMVYTAATAFTAVSSVVIPLTNDPTGVRGWDIDIWDLTLSATTYLKALFSYDGGATYKTGATDYAHNSWYNSSGITGVMSPGAAEMALHPSSTGVVATAALPAMASIRVFTRNAAGTGATRLRAHTSAYDSGGDPLSVICDAAGLGNYGRATHLKLLPATGTCSGIYRVTPQRGTGD